MANVTVETTRFGNIDVDEQLIIHFIEPLLGFEHLSRFIILDHAEQSPFKWLQSVEENDLAFVVTHPNLFGMDYDFTVPDEVIDALDAKSLDDILVLTIVNIPADNPAAMTANLLGPVLIHQQNKKAIQVVLGGTDYGTKTRLIPDDKLDTNAAAEPSSQNAPS